MSKGVLIFAFNNGKYDYFKQANWVADRVNHFLDLPVTIVTDKDSVSDTNHNVVYKEVITGDRRMFNVEDGGLSNWHNANRFQAYEASPYDETIVIDSDYIVNSDQLNTLFSTSHDFLCHRYAHDLANNGLVDAYETFGDTKFPHYWATVLFFRKTEFASTVFDMIHMVKENTEFYSKLYKFPQKPFRNDFAVSIALNTLYGHRLQSIPSIPWSLPTVVSGVDTKQISHNEFKLEYVKYFGDKKRQMVVSLKDYDFHCLNKDALEKIINGN